MTAGDAVQAAANLIAQAMDASNSGDHSRALALAGEAQAFALIALAIERGAPAPDYPDRQPEGPPAAG